jgi:hypothetical protein
MEDKISAGSVIRMNSPYVCNIDNDNLMKAAEGSSGIGVPVLSE